MTPKELGAKSARPSELGPGMYTGLTIRQEFAKAAMQGILSCGRVGPDVVDAALRYADELLAELCKKQP